MTLKKSWVSRTVRALKIGASGIALLATAGGLTAGCLDRPVAPATPRTSNVVVKTVTQSGVDKIDLLFMIDNSISMADKQEILAAAVPVLVRRLVDPICVDGEGDPTGDDSSQDGCGGGSPEFSPIKNIHIGVITSSLGNHGGDVCVDMGEMPPRTLNDQAQLVATVRPAAMPPVYSYANSGFLVWDPRMGTERPNPETHPGLTPAETNTDQFVANFAAHVAATGERGCGYEASLEAWYRFLIDPEPIATVTADGTTGLSVRGPVNNVVLTQRAQFLRPDSLLAIVMLTDENDCSIKDENDAQGWLVGRRSAMPRGSSECLRPDLPEYSCCRPCVIDVPNCPASASDVECAKGAVLPMAEDSTNLRCFNQTRRFGLNLLYPWQRYVAGLTQPRVALRAPGPMGESEVTNPIYMPGMDGTPARESSLVFLAGIIGVPWQDIATAESLQGAGLEYITAPEMAAPRDASGAPFGTDRWDVILGDPDTGRAPTDPFMIEQVEERAGTNPVPGVMAAIVASNGTGMNSINGHEQNIVNRDDLQYACIFDLVPDSPCDMTNQDGCDCNASEQAYNRPLCQYTAAGMDGTQTHAKAYPGTRHLQVLKGFGDNAIVASICPKNVMAGPEGPAGDPNYGYNPAVGAIIDRLKEALVATCLPRPLVADETTDEVPCKVVEAFQPPSMGACSCGDLPGRSDLSNPKMRGAVEDGLIENSLCGPSSGGVECSSYCMCEIQQFAGADLQTCQNSLNDPMTISGYCYVDPDHGQGNPELVAKCPSTQRQIIRFLGDNVPRARAIAFIACLGDSAAAGGTVDAGM